ncbi:MAG: FxsA family protein [Alphaproteobacteria bacterium]|nr:FxsA family protein [Alphaproteobacteria bacterium]
MPFFIIFLIIPLIEVGLFIAVGGEIGVFSTLMLCVLTAVLGAAIIRHQGIETLFSVRSAVDQGKLPVQGLFDGLCLAIAGALLLTPGFFTDAIGFSLLVPGLRRTLFRLLTIRFGMTVSGFSGQDDTQVIDATFEVIDDERSEKGNR